MSEIQVCPLAALSIEKLQEDLRESLPGWSDANPSENTIGYLRWFHELTRKKGFTVREANKFIFEIAIQKLRERSETGEEKAKLLGEKYRDNLPQSYFMVRDDIASSVFNQRSKSARTRLAEIILQIEYKVRDEHREKQRMRLEKRAPGKLFGAEATQDDLQKYASPGAGPYLIELGSEGGGGKTTQVDYFCREMLSKDIWDEIYWISAKQEKLTDYGHLRDLGQPILTNEIFIERLLNQCFPERTNQEPVSHDKALLMVTEHLKQRRRLIVIDNMESVADKEALLALLEGLANPSKVIWTTREEIQDNNLPIAHLKLPALTKTEALSLMRAIAHTKNLTQVNDLSDEELARIYDKVGGNPLALCIATGLIARFGLDLALDNIENNQNFFDYLYSYSWQRLPKTARAVLLAMLLLSPRGGEYALLAHITQMKRSELLKALDELIALSLVQPQGNGPERFFLIHPLTRTFLHQEMEKGKAEPVTEENVFPDFDTYITRAVDYIRAEVEASGTLSQEHEREQVFHSLAFGLDLATRNNNAWLSTRALLVSLMPKLERSSFHAEWMRYVKQGITVSEMNADLHHRALLQLHLGALYRMAGHYAAAQDVLALSATYFEQIDDKHKVAAAVAQRAYLYVLQRHHEQARPLIQQVLSLLPDTDAQREYIYYIQGLLALNDNDGATAQEKFEMSIQCCQTLGDKRLLAKRFGSLGTAYYMQGKSELALAQHEYSLILLKDLQDDAQIAITQIGIGIVALATQKPEKAFAIFEKAEPSLRRVHDVLHLAVLDTDRGIAKKQLKEWTAAEEFFLRAISRYQQLKDFYREANARYEYALMRIEQELVEDARHALIKALDCLAQGEPSPGRDALHRKIAERLAQLRQ